VAGLCTKISPPSRAGTETTIKKLEPIISEPTVTLLENLLIASPHSCVAFVEGKVSSQQILLISRISFPFTAIPAEGKLNEKHYESLRDEISTLYEKIFGEKIKNTLHNNKNNPTNKKPTEEQLSLLKSEIKNAFSEGKLNEKHYDLLSKDILDLESKSDKN
jgi:hypothetical protein